MDVLQTRRLKLTIIPWNYRHPTQTARLRLNQDTSNKTRSNSPFSDKPFTENVNLLLVKGLQPLFATS